MQNYEAEIARYEAYLASTIQEAEQVRGKLAIEIPAWLREWWPGKFAEATERDPENVLRLKSVGKLTEFKEAFDELRSSATDWVQQNVIMVPPNKGWWWWHLNPERGVVNGISGLQDQLRTAAGQLGVLLRKYSFRDEVEMTIDSGQGSVPCLETWFRRSTISKAAQKPGEPYYMLHDRSNTLPQAKKFGPAFPSTPWNGQVAHLLVAYEARYQSYRAAQAQLEKTRGEQRKELARQALREA